ncbi:MAG: globin domain-containing protein [Allosphingosinicella sp.]
MSNMISEKVRDNLFHSFAAVEAAAPAIKAAMTPSLALAEGEPAPFAKAGSVAVTLVDMMIEQARPMAEGRRPRGLEAVAAGHRLQGIDGRHYSRFGDALTPVLRDAVGRRLSSEVTAAWGDAFWFVIRLVMRSSTRRPLPAGGEVDGGRAVAART